MNTTSKGLFSIDGQLVAEIPRRGDPFEARKLLESKSWKAGVKISHISGKFQRHFLDDGGKTEPTSKPRVLSRSRLLVLAADGGILDELGGAAKVETHLADICYLMGQQPRGEMIGPLLVGNGVDCGMSNLFYVTDRFGVLCVVQLKWSTAHSSPGWSLDAWDPAMELSKWTGWDPGNQVFYPRPAEHAQR